jgi:hypothetical protein
MKSELLRHLRKSGRNSRDLRYSVRTMRQALASPGGHVHIGPAGVSIEFVGSYGGSARLSGYGLDHVAIALPLIALGLPAIDTRACEAREDFVEAVIRCPICAVDGKADPLPEDGRWHGFSTAPLSVLIEHWRAYGATIINGDRNRVYGSARARLV